MIIGLTGQSGAGKSTVSGVFESKGFSVIDCDRIARETAQNRAFLNELSGRFPQKLLNPDGSLNRQATADLIYNDARAREKYQRVIFPYIIYEMIREIKELGGIVVLDAPTLFEAGVDIICDSIVAVTADTELCVRRIAERDKIAEQKARERLSSQYSAEFFKEHSDHCIENSTTEADLRENAARVADKIKGGLWKSDSK